MRSFMSKGNIVAGIDIGSSKITTIISQVYDEAVSDGVTASIIGVSSVESRGIKKGQIVDIEEAVGSMIESVEGAERMAGYHLSHAYISLGGAHVGSQNSHGVVAVSDPDGEITQTDVDRVMDAASAVSLPSSRELVHILPREFIVDGEDGIRDPIGMSGVRLEVQTHLITASSGAVKNIRKALNDVGISVDEFVYTGIAASEATLTKTEKELGCILVEIGGGTTGVTVYVDGGIASSFVLPIGAKNVTNDLAIGLRVSLEAAEKIKLFLSEQKARKAKDDKEPDEIDLKQIGVVESKKISRKTLVEGIIRPRLNEIFTMVKLQVERDGLLAKVPAGVILSGGGAETVGIIDSAKRILLLPVRVGKPKGVSGLIDDIISPSFSVPVGLILFGSNQIAKGVSQRGFGIPRKITLSSKGIVSRIVESIRDLLP